MTAVLEGGEWPAARPGRTLTPGKTRYPFYGRLGGSQGRSGRAENLVPTGILSRTVQPVAQSLYQLPVYISSYIIFVNETASLHDKKTGNLPIKVKIEELSRKNVCRGKAMIITYYVCVCFVSFVIQRTKRMCPIVCTVVCDLSGSTMFSHKRNDFSRKRY